MATLKYRDPTGEWKYFSSLAGPTGPTGPLGGPPGPQGEPGPTGPTGPAGAIATSGFMGSWNPDTVYPAGATVMHQGFYYGTETGAAAGQEPGAVSGERDVSPWIALTTAIMNEGANEILIQGGFVPNDPAIELWVNPDYNPTAGDPSGMALPKRTIAHIDLRSLRLAPGETLLNSVALAPGYRLYRIRFSRPCRFRIYVDQSGALSDVYRPIGTEPNRSHGLILERVAAEDNLLHLLIPVVDGWESMGHGTVYYTVSNTEAVELEDLKIELLWLMTEQLQSGDPGGVPRPARPRRFPSRG